MDDFQVEDRIADDLLVGAEKIAYFLYGDPMQVRDVYRNPAGLSFFKHGNSIAAFKSTLRAELSEAQEAARQERQRLKESAPARPVARRGRRPREAAAR